MKTKEFETLSNTITSNTSKQAQELLDKTLKREQEDKCILKAIDQLERWEGKKVQRVFNEEIGFEVTAMKEDTFEVVKAIRFDDSVIYQAPFYVREYKNKLERVENPSEVKIREFKERFKVERDGDFYYLGDLKPSIGKLHSGEISNSEFMAQLNTQRELIERLVKESKFNRV